MAIIKNISLTEKSIPENAKVIYRFMNGKEVIYVGKANHFNERMKTHYHLSPECYAQITSIEVITLDKKDDIDEEEQLQISYFKPKYNKAKTGKKMPMYTWFSNDWHAVEYTTPHFEECKRLFAELIQFKKLQNN